MYVCLLLTRNIISLARCPFQACKFENQFSQMPPEVGQVIITRELIPGVSVVAQWLTNLTRNHEVADSTLALLSGLRIRCCCELWCTSQNRLGSHLAVAVAVV